MFRNFFFNINILSIIFHHFIFHFTFRAWRLRFRSYYFFQSIFEFRIIFFVIDDRREFDFWNHWTHYRWFFLLLLTNYQKNRTKYTKVIEFNEFSINILSWYFFHSMKIIKIEFLYFFWWLKIHFLMLFFFFRIVRYFSTFISLNN